MSIAVYFDRLPQCLMTFQFIEEVLKVYIHAVDLAIHVKMKGFIHYEVPGKELWRQPLGSLIREFDRRTDKKDIVASLRELTEERNLFAHRGYLISHEESAGNEDISKLIVRLDITHAKAKECLKSLIQEGSRVRGGPISDDLLNQLAS